MLRSLEKRQQSYLSNMYNPYSYYPNAGEPIWVQGEEGAKAYAVPAGKTYILWDSESPIFYMKSTDMNNMPQPLRKFKFEEVIEAQPQYATIDDVKKYIDEVLKKNEPNQK